VVNNGEIPDKSAFPCKYFSERLWSMLIKCWSKVPTARPTSIEALDYCSEIKASSISGLLSLSDVPILNILSWLDANSILSCRAVSLSDLHTTSIFKVKFSHANGCIWSLKRQRFSILCFWHVRDLYHLPRIWV
jgi:hypothetical protein